MDGYDAGTMGTVAAWVVPIATGVIGFVIGWWRRTSPTGKAKAHLAMAKVYAEAQMSDERKKAIQSARELLVRVHVQDAFREKGKFKIMSNLDVVTCVSGLVVLVLALWLFTGQMPLWVAQLSFGGTVIGLAVMLATGFRQWRKEDTETKSRLKNLPEVTESDTDRPDRADATGG